MAELFGGVGEQWTGVCARRDFPGELTGTGSAGLLGTDAFSQSLVLMGQGGVLSS